MTQEQPIYTLVWTQTDECGCLRLDWETVHNVIDAAQLLLDRGIMAYNACLVRGRAIADQYDNDNPLDLEFSRIYSLQQEAGERAEYERLKARYEP